MRPRRFSQSAQASIRDIALYIAADNPTKADEYVDAVERQLTQFDERFLPRRIFRHRHTVYVLNVYGFSGYLLWLVLTEEAIVVVAAFRPGLTDAMQTDRAQPGFDEL